MSICVDRNSKTFSQTVERLDIHPDNLELILHDFLNDESRGGEAPSDSEILEQITPKSFTTSAEGIKLYNSREYSKPTVFLSIEEANKECSHRDSLFGKGSSIVYRNKKGEFVVKTGLAVSKEMKEIQDRAIANGTYLLAPNGNPTNLTGPQWLQVRTKEFKDWFGDWENDPENASKVVDKNGEPMVVYHRSPDKFNIFDANKIGSTTDSGQYGKGFYFGMENDRGEGNNIYEVFLNIKNPYFITKESRTSNIAYTYNRPFNEWRDWHKEHISKEENTLVNSKDGIIDLVEDNEFVVRNSNQIKSATSNTGEFSTYDNNIFNNKEFRGIYDALSYIQKLKYSFEDPILGNVKKQIINKIGKTYYITKTDSEYAKQLLEIHRERLFLPKGIFKIETKGENQIVTVDESVLEDLIERNNNSQAFGDLFSSAEEAEKVRDVLDFLSSKTGLNYQTISETEAAKLLKKRKGSIQNVNAFVHNNTCYFIQGRKLNVDIASEEMLHPFINAVYIKNPALFSSLLKEAKKLFPKLRLEIAEAYKNESQEVREQELVTQTLSRAFREERKNTPKGRKLASIIDKFLNFVKELFGAGNKDYILADEIDSNTTIQDLAKIINTDLKLVYNSKFGKITRMNNDPSSINIYASTGENTNLSNFAEQKKEVWPKNDPLSDILQEKLQELGIQIKEADLEGLSGKFVANEHTIYYNPNSIQGNTIVHEAIHAISTYYLNITDQKSLPKNIKTAIKEINYCYNLLKDAYIKENFYENGNPKEGVDIEKAFNFWVSDDQALYGLSSPSEMIAELTNPKFIEYIRKVDAKHKGKNIFKKLIDSILELFNVNKQYKSIEKTVKDALMEMINNPNKQLLDTYAKERQTVKDNLKKLKESKHIVLERVAGDAILEKLESLPEGTTEASIEITLDISSVENQWSMKFPKDATKPLTGSNKGALMVYQGQLFTSLNGKVVINEENKTVTLPLKVYSLEALSTQELSVKEGSNGVSYVEPVTPTSSKVETFKGNWSREEVAKQTDKVFLFGDNTNDRTNTHYVPSMTQAVIRGLPNAIGIDTKKNRGTGESSYFTDEDFDTFKAQVDNAIQQALDSGKTIVIPEGGIGTGKAQLQQRAPKLFNYLQEQLNRLQQEELQSIEDNDVEQDLEEEQEEQNIPELTEENKQYMERMERINQQLNNLQESSVLSATEVRDISEQMVYWISDFITRLQSEPNYAVQQFGDQYSKNDFSKMSRLEIVNTIGLMNIIARCKGEFKPRPGTYKSLKTISKARQIYDNFEAVLFIASDIFVLTENFSLNLSKDGSFIEVNTNINEDNDNFNDSNTEFDIKELLGDLQEHWQIETKTRDVINQMSSPVKRVLRQCIIKDKDGNPELTEFGVKKRVNIREATNSILKWTQGSITFEDMIAKLSEKAEKHPWLNDILEKLNDKTGAYTDFQSQFFGDFCKHFQSYYVVIEENGKFKSIPVNEEPALSSIYKQIEAQYKAGEHTLFGLSGVNESAFNDLKDTLEELTKYKDEEVTEDNIQEISRLLGYASSALGHITTPELVSENLDTKGFKDMLKALNYMVNAIGENLDNINYTPFKFKSGGDIVSNLKNFLRPITQSLEDTTVASIYNNGKMYQSYITPSYTTKLFHKFSSDPESFERFIEQEYGEVPFFKNPDNDRWRNEWLKEMTKNPESRKLFKHKVQLNFNKRNYMKDMNDMEYTVSVLTEYFAESHKGKGGEVPAWFRVPMLSNKPSSEFIRFISYRGPGYRDTLTTKFCSIFRQELDRIQTVMARNLDKTDPDYIENFDKNGKKFVFLEFLNDYLPGNKKADTELGKAIKSYLNGEKGIDMALNTEAKKVIKEAMEARAQSIVNDWKSQGISKASLKVDGAGKTKEEVRENLINFVWNDTFAAMNIMQLTITDPAYYKHAEDLQKRLAQIHAPGVRGRSNVRDYGKLNENGEFEGEGTLVDDGKFRTIKLKDFAGIVSNVIDNITEVFDRKIANAPEHEKAALEALKESLVGKDGDFRKINVADAQGYSCPTSYRKKAFRFGKWSKDSEKVWKKLKEGNYTYSDLQVAFQPLKPFVYSQVTKETGVSGAKFDKIKVPVQFKNSEYLLIMADAILQGEETSKPNLLRAIFEIMEESHFDEKTGEYRTDGIDTVQFESTTKSGLSGAISVNDLVNKEYGEVVAINRIKSDIYKEDGSYTNAVDVIPAEDYCLQQEVPEHFKNHHQVHGSQGRYIIPSEIESVNPDGTPATYTIIDPNAKDGKKEVSASDFKKEYEDTIAKNIKDSIDTLVKELHLENFDIKNRNIALSRILQKEILASPRYGIDLLQACSIDKDGNFRIPLGDPIQSKRVEQLLTSIVKNRVNKQEIAGGPVVQVSNFGTSKQLSIKFKDKVTGGILMSKEEWENNKTKHSSYDDYKKEHQGGIAYFECFAPIYANEIFSKFADKDGNIDIQTIEDIDPELLKMVGYRIPTEDKYSMAPLKIVGFLPREAGDGIMLPYDITTLSGSDFDVDKMYLMIKEIMISSRNTKFNKLENEALEESEEKYIAKHKQAIIDHIVGDIKLRSKLSKNEIAKIESEIGGNYKLREMAENRRHEQALEDIESRFAHIDELNEKALEETSSNSTKGYLDKKSDRIDKDYEKAIKAENKKHENRLLKLQQAKEDAISNKISKEMEFKVQNKVKEFLNLRKKDKSIYDDPLMRDIRRSYYRYMYHTVYPTSGKEYRNNKIVDMTYEILTHETSADKVLNPGGFEPQKKMGYMVSVFRNPEYNYTWEELEAMRVDELKDLSNVDKNLSYIDTHVQFYKQNAAAGSLIGVFAVHRTAHAVIESSTEDGSSKYKINVDRACKISKSFTILGMEFGGQMPFDMRYDRNGQLIGKVLGSLVASSADAVKDPVLNLMNINGNTANIMTTLVRMGMPFDDAALFLSQSAITDILNTYSQNNITSRTSFIKVVNERLEALRKEHKIGRDSEINTEELTREELIKGLKPGVDPKTEYKVLLALSNISSIAKALRLPTFATRFNSSSGSPGPLMIDNLITEYTMEELNDNSCIIDDRGYSITMEEIFKDHPIIDMFKDAISIANELLKDMPANSRGFRNILDTLKGEPILNTLLRERKLLGSLSDFYQSYLLIQNGVIDENDLSYYISDFPREFKNNNIKTNEKYKDNLLIQAIKYTVDKNNRLVLSIDTTGLDTQAKEKLSAAWADLHKIDSELSLKLFKYCFFKGGIGYNPKTFMNLLPIQVKEKIPGYVDTYRKMPRVSPDNVFDQFIRNNWNKDALVPRKKTVTFTHLSDGKLRMDKRSEVDGLYNTSYFKVKVGEQDKLYKIIERGEIRDSKFLICEEIAPLGNNNDYMEMSTEIKTSSLHIPSEALIQEQAEDVGKDSELASNNVDDFHDDSNSSVDETAKLEQILEDILVIEGVRTKQQAEEKRAEFRKMSPAEQSRLESPMKKFFTNRLKVLGIEVNKQLLDDLYNLMCK